MGKKGYSQGNVAVIYGRVSTSKQEDGTSLETQESRCRKHCEGQGWAVLSVHLDVHTGAELDRPGLNAALSAIRQGKADILLAYDLDRLSRNQTHMAVILHQVETHAGRIELVNEKLEDTPIGRFIRNSMAFVAEVEREKIKERTVRGKRARAEKGAIIPGPSPLYGYKFSDDRRAFIIDEETAPIVRRIFEMAANGTTLFGIARKLDAEGIPTPTQYFSASELARINRRIATGWKHSTIHQMLHNPAYTGEHSAYRWKTTKERRENEQGEVRQVIIHRIKQGDSKEETIIPLTGSACPAIIDAELYERAHQQLTRNKAEATRNTKYPHEALLARGFVVCAYCGHSLATHYGNRPEEARYRCPRRPAQKYMYRDVCEEGAGLSVQVQKIDQDVWSKVAELLQHPEFIRKGVESWEAKSREEKAKVQGRIKSIDALIEKNHARRANLVRKLEDMDDDEDKEMLGRIKELGQEIQRLTAERVKIIGTTSSFTMSDGMVAFMNSGERFKNAARMSHMLPYEVKRQILHFFGVKVEVWRADDERTPINEDGSMGARWKVKFGWDGLNSGETIEVGDTVSVTS